MKRHPLSSVKSFTEWLGEMNCLTCKYIEQSDKPISELKCTQEYAFKTDNCDYPDGYESDKDEIRKLDIERKYEKDANEYFICGSWEEKEKI